jgi:hypothetical protein
MAQNRNSDGTFAGKNAKFKNIFDEIEKLLNEPDLKRGGKSFRIRNDVSIFSHEWFLSNVKKLSRLTTKNALTKNTNLVTNSIEPGMLLQYAYDPLEQSKIDMPAYDIFPLTIIFGKTETGFIGLNLHYLNPRMRFFLFAKLLDIGKISGSDDKKRLILTWKLLEQATKAPEFAPCVHQYRFDRVKSPFVSIPIDQWKIAVCLPNANFKKMGEQSVWAESFRQASLNRRY